MREDKTRSPSPTVEGSLAFFFASLLINFLVVPLMIDHGGVELALTIEGPKGRCLQEFLATANKAEVVSFFRGVINHLQRDRKIGAVK